MNKENKKGEIKSVYFNTGSPFFLQIAPIK